VKPITFPDFFITNACFYHFFGFNLRSLMKRNGEFHIRYREEPREMSRTSLENSAQHYTHNHERSQCLVRYMALALVALVVLMISVFAHATVLLMPTEHEYRMGNLQSSSWTDSHEGTCAQEQDIGLACPAGSSNSKCDEMGVCRSQPPFVLELMAGNQSPDTAAFCPTHNPSCKSPAAGFVLEEELNSFQDTESANDIDSVDKQNAHCVTSDANGCLGTATPERLAEYLGTSPNAASTEAFALGDGVSPNALMTLVSAPIGGGGGSAQGVLVGNGDILSGSLTIANGLRLTGSGLLLPGNSPGVITVGPGNYVMDGGTLEFEIDGLDLSDFDQIKVIDGKAILNSGTLRFVFSDNFAASVGDEFDFITASGGVDFGTLNVVIVGLDSTALAANIIESPAKLTLAVFEHSSATTMTSVPTPDTIVLILMGVPCLIAGLKRARRVRNLPVRPRHSLRAHGVRCRSQTPTQSDSATPCNAALLKTRLSSQMFG
jgi:hypothetical protein